MRTTVNLQPHIIPISLICRIELTNIHLQSHIHYHYAILLQKKLRNVVCIKRMWMYRMHCHIRYNRRFRFTLIWLLIALVLTVKITLNIRNLSDLCISQCCYYVSHIFLHHFRLSSISTISKCRHQQWNWLAHCDCFTPILWSCFCSFVFDVLAYESWFCIKPSVWFWINPVATCRYICRLQLFTST